MRYIITTILAVVCVGWTAGNTCPGKPNPNPPRDSAEKLVMTVKNGKLFVDDKVNPPMNFIHVWGSPYEMGFAYGQLIKKDFIKFADDVFTFIDKEVMNFLPPATPQWIIDFIKMFGVSAALDLTYEWTKRYTPQHFEDELQGLADGTGYDLQKLRRLNMIPELLKAQCSMVGAWGPAIPEGSLYQLRALDWAMSGPFADFPAVLIYHPDEGHNFAHMGWIGFVGALTGYSAANVGLSQKVWVDYNGTYLVDGYPFHYLLRDILQYDTDSSAALDRIMNARRTCSIFIGLGDSLTCQFRALEYSHDIVNIYSDQSFPTYPEHPKFEGLVYINKHPQPSNETCLGELMREYYGKMNAEKLIDVAAVHQTGDTHAAVYDFSHNYMYISSASSFTSGDPIVPAYNRQWLRLDLNKMWAESKP